MIFSIGYNSMLSPQQLRAIADALRADVVDVRGVPKSRKAGFGSNQLRAALGDRYVWRGAHGLGNHGDNVTTEEGIDWLADRYGLDRAQSSPAGFTWSTRRENAIIMCMEDAPAECHRHQLIAKSIPSTPVVHLWFGGGQALTAIALEEHLQTGDDYPFIDIDVMLAAPLSSVAELLEADPT